MLFHLDRIGDSLMLIATVAAEILFWACLMLGVVFRYIVKAPGIGLAFFIATPIIDIALLIFSFFTMHSDGEAGFMHGFAAFYIAFSLFFGGNIIRAVDRKLSGRSKTGSGNQSDNNLRKCVYASAVTAAILIVSIAVVGLSGSFWLIYWLIAVIFTPPMWWGAEKLSRRA